MAGSRFVWLMIDISLSLLGHTWLIDIDGTVLRHNGHKNEDDVILPGVREFWAKIPPDDTIILMSARAVTFEQETLLFFRRNGLRYTHAIFNLPVGERILINDTKPSGLKTAIAHSLARDHGFAELSISIDPLA